MLYLASGVKLSIFCFTAASYELAELAQIGLDKMLDVDPFSVLSAFLRECGSRCRIFCKVECEFIRIHDLSACR